jgi:hypothetical protein
VLFALIGPLNVDKRGATAWSDIDYDPGNLLIARKILAFEAALDKHSGCRLMDFEVFHWTSLLLISYYPIF